MVRRAIVVAALLGIGIAGSGATAEQQKPASKPSGWQLAPDADTKKSPLTVDEKVLNTGRAVFKEKCTKCHGRTGSAMGLTPSRNIASTWT